MKIEEKNGDVWLTEVTDFDIEQTMECGQCFHFQKTGEKEYVIVAMGKMLHIRQDDQQVILFDTTADEYEKIWSTYFDMERDYRKIKDFLLQKDDKLRDAIQTMGGVHILRQDFFETLISFIISQNKQIPHIKKIVAEISEKYGTYLGEACGVTCFAFPTPEQLSNVSEEKLRACKTGFRAPYIVDAVKKVTSGEVSEQNMRTMDAAGCMEELLKIKGVGVKVGNCVTLFGLEKRSSFPIDVWIKRVMEHLYFGQETSNEVIAEFAKTHFGAYGGYAQQYLFYYGRETGMGVTDAPKKEKRKKTEEKKSKREKK